LDQTIDGTRWLSDLRSGLEDADVIIGLGNFWALREYGTHLESLLALMRQKISSGCPALFEGCVSLVSREPPNIEGHAGFHDPNDWPDLPGADPSTTGLADAAREFRETAHFATIGSSITQILDTAVAQQLTKPRGDFYNSLVGTRRELQPGRSTTFVQTRRQ
jgi:hypothetical protein